MVEVLYAIERPFMRKTFEAIDRHVDVESAFVPVRTDARGCSDRIDEIDVDDPGAVDDNVRAIGPSVIVYNHRFGIERFTFYEECPLVHLRHGASIGRGEGAVTAETILRRVTAALAPGERWAKAYRAAAPSDVTVAVVGIPEADALVDVPPPASAGSTSSRGRRRGRSTTSGPSTRRASTGSPRISGTSLRRRCSRLASRNWYSAPSSERIAQRGTRLPMQPLRSRFSPRRPRTGHSCRSAGTDRSPSARRPQSPSRVSLIAAR